MKKHNVNIELHLVLVYVGSAFAAFSLAFAKAFQSRNIVLGHTRTAFATSWAVSTLEVLSVGFIIAGGWWVILSAGIGGSIGTVLAMKLHSRLFRVKPPEPLNHCTVQ